MRHRLFHVSGQFSIGRESSTRRTAGKVFHCAEKDKHAKPQVRAADFEINEFFRRILAAQRVYVSAHQRNHRMR